MYEVYSCYDQKQTTKKIIPAQNADSASGANTDIKFNGFNKAPDISGGVNLKLGGHDTTNSEFDVKHKYEKSKIIVQPGKHSTMGLTGHQPGTLKFSFRFENKEWLVKDVIARTNKDISIKINEDQKWEHITQKEKDRILEEEEDVPKKPKNEQNP